MDGRPLFLRVADLVRELGAAHVGEAGYSDVGAVAGATAPAQLRLVREALPNAFLLVPGYGAQGAGADALRGHRRRRRRRVRRQRVALHHLRVAGRRRRLSKGCGRRRRIYAQRPPGHPVTDETPKKRTRRPRPSSAAGTPPRPAPLRRRADDPDAALRRLESMGAPGAASEPAGPAPLPPRRSSTRTAARLRPPAAAVSGVQAHAARPARVRRAARLHADGGAHRGAGRLPRRRHRPRRHRRAVRRDGSDDAHAHADGQGDQDRRRHTTSRDQEVRGPERRLARRASPRGSTPPPASSWRSTPI